MNPFFMRHVLSKARLSVRAASFFFLSVFLNYISKWLWIDYFLLCFFDLGLNECVWGDSVARMAILMLCIEKFSLRKESALNP